MRQTATGRDPVYEERPYTPEEVAGEFGWLMETSFWRLIHTFSCPLGEESRVRFFAAHDPDDDEEEAAELHRGKPYVTCVAPAEAAAEIEGLRAEIERLREALREIAALTGGGAIHEIARAVLRGEGEDE